MPNVTIEGKCVRIGKNVKIFPNVVIYDDSIIKDNCIIQAGAIIGSDGLAIAHTKMGEHIKIHHSGNVVLEEDVEVGSNSTIDRAAFDQPSSKKGQKLTISFRLDITRDWRIQYFGCTTGAFLAQQNWPKCC